MHTRARICLKSDMLGRLHIVALGLIVMLFATCTCARQVLSAIQITTGHPFVIGENGISTTMSQTSGEAMIAFSGAPPGPQQEMVGT